MYDFSPPIKVVLVQADGTAQYLYHAKLKEHFLDVVPQVGDSFTTLWPFDDSDTVRVVAPSLVDQWEYPAEKAWLIVIADIEPTPIEAVAFEALRQMTRLQMEARGIAPRDPDND